MLTKEQWAYDLHTLFALYLDISAKWARLKHRLKCLFLWVETENCAACPRGSTVTFFTPLIGYQVGQMGFQPDLYQWSDRVWFGFLQHPWPKEGSKLYLFNWEKIWRSLNVDTWYDSRAEGWWR